jgi:GH15 family glucan-1,4-alpha-glucosidase
MPYQPIENYGIIGDLHTVALVGMDGSIDFMCFPHFDSPTIFARLLDHQRGGHFSITPQLTGARRKQLYLPNTNVLLTRFLAEGSVAELSDFMPVESEEACHDLVRRAKTVRGEVRYRMVCSPAFDYARRDHRVRRGEEEVTFEPEGWGGPILRLRSQRPVQIADGAAIAEFTLRAGETAAFILEEVKEGVASPSAQPNYVSEAFKRTVDYWHAWIGQSQYEGRWREVVARSALTLKLLTSSRHGSMVAAPTFGLPERIGGERNWDYRYAWVRDASFVLYALIRLGFTQEAADFMGWLEGLCGDIEGGGSLRAIYTLEGGSELEERSLDHLEGYRGSRPVRIGNGAYDQLQLDIFGELMDSVYLHNKHGDPISNDLWHRLIPMIDWLCDHWRQPDQGIWEVRGGRQEFLYSRVLSWVAVDRAMRLARKRSLPAPLNRWRSVRDEIYREVFQHFWDEDRGAFVQYKGGHALDAASLIMPLVRFISPTDPRWLSHLEAVKDELVEDSMVFRYRTSLAAADGFSGEEGTFSMCTFWFVECLSRSGQLKQARLHFEKMLGYANHLGLYSEELGPCGEHLGNFPQAFTHLALISAAFDLDRRLSAAGERG